MSRNEQECLESQPVSTATRLSLSHRIPPQAADVRPKRPNHSRFKTPNIHRTKLLRPMKGQSSFAICNGGSPQYDHELQNNLHAHTCRVSQLCKQSTTFKRQQLQPHFHLSNIDKNLNTSVTIRKSNKHRILFNTKYVCVPFTNILDVLSFHNLAHPCTNTQTCRLLVQITCVYISP